MPRILRNSYELRRYIGERGSRVVLRGWCCKLSRWPSWVCRLEPVTQALARWAPGVLAWLERQRNGRADPAGTVSPWVMEHLPSSREWRHC